ncbi:VOC family protein [Aestuariibacter halophilus]|uniref:VOC family protein n=1 Tax=Fluctibacter halophilus TaxID=226011 RepID=A0ABS8G522_9ALTE|nr:VOC family protein [Aestuariibacter halophilus]MCC2615236.1 VOC family protein [Aestuariibacter halophilus]
MSTTLSAIQLLVDDYQAALDYYCKTLDFVCIEDEVNPDGSRWVKILPSHYATTALVLHRAVSPAQQASLGRQAGDAVFGILYCEDCEQTYQQWQSRGVQFEQPPVSQAYGTVAIFSDYLGNRWDLIGPPTDH